MAYTAPAAAFVLHRTRICKVTMNFGIDSQWRRKLFLLSSFIYRVAIVKAAMNAPRLWNYGKKCLTGVG
jgi:hypothetical protein